MNIEKNNNPLVKRRKRGAQSSPISSTNVGGNLETLPIDLIIEILKRLPAKTIALCRCVSTQWNSLLGSPDFTNSFLTSSSTRPQLLITFQFKGKWHFFSCPQQVVETVSVVTPDYHMGVSGNWYKYKYICLSLNGLVFLYDKQMVKGKMKRVPVLCNPSTGQHITLPKVRANNIDLRSFVGYDPIENQFKVLCMTVTKYGSQRNSKEHHVMTLGKGKLSWRKIECEFPHFPHKHRKGICINGILYYVAYLNNFTNVLACFDVKSEKFVLVQIDHYALLTLINYKGTLGVLVGDSSVDGNPLWVLDDGKWLKHVLYFPYMDSLTLKSVWGTDKGEVVWAQWSWRRPFYVFYYNVERQSVRRVEIQGIEEKVFMNPNDRPDEVFTFPNHVENLMMLQ